MDSLSHCQPKRNHFRYFPIEYFQTLKYNTSKIKKIYSHFTRVFLLITNWYRRLWVFFSIHIRMLEIHFVFLIIVGNYINWFLKAEFLEHIYLVLDLRDFHIVLIYLLRLHLAFFVYFDMYLAWKFPECFIHLKFFFFFQFCFLFICVFFIL